MFFDFLLDRPLHTFEFLLFTGFFLVIWGIIILLYPDGHLILTLIGLELTLFGLSFLCLLIYILTYALLGHIFILILLTLGAAETAIGLSLIMLYYSFKNTIKLTEISDLKF